MRCASTRSFCCLPEKQEALSSFPAVRVLPPFDIRELRELMETDEMELDTLGDRKTALFVIISDTDDTL